MDKEKLKVSPNCLRQLLLSKKRYVPLLKIRGESMLLIEHKAHYLYREDAYREYCWSVDAYGSWQPASFIYLSFEAFKNLCFQCGLRLVHTSKISHNKNHFPWRFEQDLQFKNYEYSGLITRITDLKIANEIKKALNIGKNVIALLPNEMLGLWFSKNEDMLNESIKAAFELGIKEAEKKINPPFASSKDRVWWEEIPTNTKGRLFITRDSFLSDGFFMDGYGKTEENLKKIKELIQEFSIFKYPMLSATIQNAMSIWPCHEPLNLIVDIKNHGPTLEYTEIQLDLPDTFEPLGSIERVMSHLRTLKKASFAFQVIPRTNGKFKDFLKIKITSQSGEILPLHFSPIDVEISPSYSDSLRRQNKQDDQSLSKLISVFKKARLYDEVKVLPELVQIDVRSCISRIRSTVEKLVYLVLERKAIKLREKKLVLAIAELQNNRILSSKSIGYLHTIRVIGNLASHPNDESLTDADVRVVSYALSCVVEEMINKGLL